MPGICRNNVDLAGVCDYGLPPTNANSGSPDVFVNNNELHRVGDTFTPHGCGTRVSTGGSSSVFCNNQPVTRLGDPVNDGAVIITASDNVYAGG